MKNLIIATLLLSASLFAAPNFEPKIAIQNSILAQVNDTTISVIDVKKKLDFAFHQSYPQLADSTPSKFQFYQNSWRPALMEMIDNELILADAVDREIKVTDGEVREELESRFGPSVMASLDKMGLSYDEAWKMLKNEMTVQRMVWFFIQSKAIQSVTPQEIRQAYHLYLKENPPYQEWKYRVISIRSSAPEAIQGLSDELYRYLVENGQSPESLGSELKALEKEGAAIQVSTEYTANDLDLSEAHRTALSSLSPGQYGKPSIQTSRIDKKTVARIFYLGQKIDHPALSFEEISPKLKSDLTQKALTVESSTYIAKLRKHYGYDNAHLKQSVPENLTPFSLE